MSSKNPCGTNRCSCRSNNIQCVTACGDCQGRGCANNDNIGIPDDDVNDNNDNFSNEDVNLFEKLFGAI